MEYIKYKNPEVDKIDRPNLCDECELYTLEHSCLGKMMTDAGEIICKDCWTKKCKNCHNIWWI